jgi:hypothetical protein
VVVELSTVRIDKSEAHVVKTVPDLYGVLLRTLGYTI